MLADGDQVKFRNAMLFDLTQMFGSGKEPTLAEFNSYFPENYYEYNTGELLSFDGTQITTIGFNLLDYNSTYLTIGSYRYAYLPLGATNELYMALVDKDTSVDISGIYLGFAINDTSSASPIAFRWILSNGNIQNNHTNRATSPTDPSLVGAL